jgi:hypothetical protein
VNQLKLWTSALCLLVLGISPRPCRPATEPRDQEEARLSGAWQDVADPSHGVLVQDGRLIDFASGSVRTVAKILDRQQDKLRLCEFGADSEKQVLQGRQSITLRDVKTGTAVVLRRAVPDPTLILKPLDLPEAGLISEERVRSIQEEIWKRFREDQETLFSFEGGPPGPPEEPWREPVSRSRPRPSQPVSYFQVVEVAAKNTVFLRSLLTEVGWIDVKRFGYSASHAAALLAQHSRDVPLMMAVVPAVERDAKAGLMDQELYALLFDRLELLLGERQRYGTQLGWDDDNRPLLLPVEDSSRVDALRQTLGMEPVGKYLAVFGENDVRFSQACSVPELDRAQQKPRVREPHPTPQL